MQRPGLKILLLTFLLLSAIPAAAERLDDKCRPDLRGREQHYGERPGRKDHRIYGGYCKKRHSDHYGARQPLATLKEAKQRLRYFYSLPDGQVILQREVRIGYIADIVDENGVLYDRVIIDKRTGRIRSIR